MELGFRRSSAPAAPLDESELMFEVGANPRLTKLIKSWPHVGPSLARHGPHFAKIWATCAKCGTMLTKLSTTLKHGPHSVDLA